MILAAGTSYEIVFPDALERRELLCTLEFTWFFANSGVRPAPCLSPAATPKPNLPTYDQPR